MPAIVTNVIESPSMIKYKNNNTLLHKVQRALAAEERLRASGQWIDSPAIVATGTSLPILQLSRPGPNPGKREKTRNRERSPLTDRIQMPERGRGGYSGKDRGGRRSGSISRDSSSQPKGLQEQGPKQHTYLLFLQQDWACFYRLRGLGKVEQGRRQE